VDIRWPFGVLEDQQDERAQYFENFCPGTSVRLLSFHTDFTIHEICIPIVHQLPLENIHPLELEEVTSVVDHVKSAPIPVIKQDDPLPWVTEN